MPKGVYAGNKKDFCLRGHSYTLVGQRVNGTCKACAKEQSKRWRALNPEKHKAYMVRWRKANPSWQKPEDHRNAVLKHRFGISVEQWDVMYANQKGCCAVCGRHQSSLSKRLSVDHNHVTGKIRGLLCDRCNRFIVMVAENYSEFFQSAVDYLERANG